MKEKTNWLVDLVKQLGFPVVVTGWLLYERFQTMTQLTDAINNNTAMIQQIMHKIGG